jgi:hypothetical protein
MYFGTTTSTTIISTTPHGKSFNGFGKVVSLI